MRSMFPSQSVFILGRQSSGTSGTEASKRDHLMVFKPVKANPRRRRYNGPVNPAVPQNNNQQKHGSETMRLKRRV